MIFPCIYTHTHPLTQIHIYKTHYTCRQIAHTQAHTFAHIPTFAHILTHTQTSLQVDKIHTHIHRDIHLYTHACIFLKPTNTAAQRHIKRLFLPIPSPKDSVAVRTHNYYGSPGCIRSWGGPRRRSRNLKWITPRRSVRQLISFIPSPWSRP